MSRTEKRNGERVFKAAMEIAAQHAYKFGFCALVGQVAERAQVSHPTARKYLDICVDAGIAERVVFVGSPLLVYVFSEVE